MLSISKKIPYKNMKKKLHLLVLLSKFYLNLWFRYFWDTLYNVTTLDTKIFFCSSHDLRVDYAVTALCC